MPSTSRRYRMHGLVFESDVPLEGAAAPAGEADFRIRLGATREVPASAPDGRLLAELEQGELSYWAAAGEADPERWLLRFGGWCDVDFDRTARAMEIHPAPTADPGSLALIAGGSLVAHAVAAAGHLVLHASAVELDGRGIAIAGLPGSGKSTFAALLCGRGGRLVTEDVARVDVSGGGARCHPGNRVLRLRPVAAEAAEAIPGAELTRSADGRLAVRPPAAETPVALAAVVFPARRAGAGPPVLERLSEAEALAELLRHPRLIGWCDPEPIRWTFARTAELAPSVRAFRLTMPAERPFASEAVDRLVEAAS